MKTNDKEIIEALDEVRAALVKARLIDLNKLTSRNKRFLGFETVSGKYDAANLAIMGKTLVQVEKVLTKQGFGARVFDKDDLSHQYQKRAGNIKLVATVRLTRKGVYIYISLF